MVQISTVCPIVNGLSVDNLSSQIDVKNGEYVFKFLDKKKSFIRIFLINIWLLVRSMYVTFESLLSSF